MDLEEAFQVVGEFGPYQKRAVAVLVLTQVCERNRERCVDEKPGAAAETWHSANRAENRHYVAFSGGLRLEDHKIQFSTKTFCG